MKQHPVLLLLIAMGLAPWGAAWAESPAGLKAALSATLTGHPALSGKRAEVDAKSHIGDSVRAQLYPTLSTEIAANDNDSQPTILRARQPLWAFGRIDSNIAFSDADVSAEEADLLRLRRQLMEQTAVAYARVLGSQQRVRVAEDNVAGLDRLYQQVGRREQGQLASSADVRLALARLAPARAQRERYDGELAVALTELRTLTQVAVDVDQPVPRAMTVLPPVAELDELAQAQSAEVLFKAQQVELARAGVLREQKAPMPTVYLQADRHINNPAFGNDTQVGVVFEATLDGLGFAAAGRNGAAHSRLQASEDELTSSRNEITRTVSSLYTNRQAQESLIEAHGQAVSELTEILASYQRQYEAGQKAWLDVLNIQRELTEQRLQQIQAENDWLVFSLKLVALSGGLDDLLGAPQRDYP
jgi:outer membrane protein, adhesin transport system